MNKEILEEIRKLLITFNDAIRSSNNLGVYDFINLGFSILSIVFSFIAIIVAIRVPKKIAKQQDKIALFDRRYELFHELKMIHDFMKEYYKVLKQGGCESLNLLPDVNVNELSDEQKAGLLYQTLWEGSIHAVYYQDNSNPESILMNQKRIIQPISLLFDNVTTKEEEECTKFFNTYVAMTHRYVLLAKSSYYYPFKTFEESYIPVFLTNTLKKMREQIKLI